MVTIWFPRADHLVLFFTLGKPIEDTVALVLSINIRVSPAHSSHPAVIFQPEEMEM